MLDDNGADGKAMFSLGGNAIPAGKAGGIYDPKTESWIDMKEKLKGTAHKVQRMYQDHHLDLKRYQEKIIRAGGVIEDNENAYVKETLAYGKIGERLAKFEATFNKDVNNAIMKAKDSSKVTLDDVHYYMSPL